MVHLLGDKKGAVTIQFLLLLPILLIIVIGGFEVWKILYVRQTMNDAAYQGVRLLAMQPYHEDVPDQVDKLVRRYVVKNPFVDPRLLSDPDDRSLLGVDVKCQSPPECGSLVSVEVLLKWIVGREWGADRWVPFLGREGWLQAYAEGWVICERQDDVD